MDHAEHLQQALDRLEKRQYAHDRELEHYKNIEKDFSYSPEFSNCYVAVKDGKILELSFVEHTLAEYLLRYTVNFLIAKLGSNYNESVFVGDGVFQMPGGQKK